MSYTRWSTDIKNTVPWEEVGFLIQNGAFKFVKKLQHRRHAEYSDWYIFWHYTDAIAIWNKHDKDAPLYSFDDVMDMYFTGDYSALPVVTQEEYLDEVLGIVVDDIIEEGEEE